MRITNFFILLFCVTFSTIAQTDLKKVTINDLKQPVHPTDSTASAAVLFDQGELTFNFDSGWHYTLKSTTRIKIYNQDGYDQANIKIPFYKGKTKAQEEEISDLEAKIYNLENDEIMVTEIDKKDIFEEEVSEVFSQVKFTFPKVKDGSIIEYSYEYTSPHINSLPTWSFQQDIPVVFSEIKLIFPDKFLNYKPVFRGFHNVETNESIKSGNITVRSSQNIGSSSQANLDTEIKTVIHKASDIPKIVGESYVNNISNYLTSVKYELVAYRGFSLTSPRKFLNVTWEDVIKALYKSSNFGDKLEDQRYYKDDIQPLIANSKTPIEKMNAIFNFVKNKVEWNGESRLYASDKLKNIYKNGKGNSADINLMLTSMLQYANLDAKPLISSTISNGIPFSPTLTGLNYVTARVKIGEDTYLLDATNKYTKPNMLPRRALNWNGIIASEAGVYKDINLMPTSLSKINTTVSANLSSEGIINGKVRQVFDNYFGLNYRSSVTDTSIESQIESIEESNEFVKVSNLSNTNLEDISKPVMRSYDFKIESGFVDAIGDKLYISPMLYFATEENPFKEKTRSYPIDFTYPRASRVIFTIKIPEGYVVDYVPEKVAIGLPDNTGTFQYLAVANSEKIQVTVMTKINANILPATYYASLKEFFQTIVEKENEKIALKKS
jgi:transglutaminase-like putative cysteine protease